MLGQQGSGADIRPGGFQAIRPAVKAFVFGGGIYGKASIPLTLSGQSNLGLLVGGGYELKLLGLLGGFVEANTGYEGAAGGVVPMEMRRRDLGLVAASAVFRALEDSSDVPIAALGGLFVRSGLLALNRSC